MVQITNASGRRAARHGSARKTSRETPPLTFERMLTWIPPTIFILAVTLQGSRVFSFLSFDVSRVGLQVQLGLVGCYLFLALYRLHFGVCAVGIALVLYVLTEHLWFSELARSAPNYNAMASYLPILSFVVFCEARASFNDLLRVVLVIAIVYLAIYVIGQSFLLQANAGSIAILPATPGRPSRLYLLGSWASFAAFYGLHARRLHIVARSALIFLAFTALWLNGSRTFQVLFTAFFVIAALGLTGWRMRLVIFTMVIMLTLLTLAGIVFEKWNPYELMYWDASASYRAAAYPRVIDGIKRYWLFGVGLPANAETLSQFLRIPRDEILFPSDLGTAGMAFMLGAPGLFGCIAAVWFILIGSNAGKDIGPAILTLRLNVMLAASITWMSPMIFVEPSAIFLGLIVALHTRVHRRKI